MPRAKQPGTGPKHGEAQLLVDAELRDESFEERARDLDEREVRLTRLEDQLVAYVAQV